MIELRSGDILLANVEALVNTVNCVGFMGRGIALQFKRAFPANFVAYESACRRGELRPGRMFVYELGRLTNPRYVINFPTKEHWRAKSKLEHIDAGLDDLVAEVRRLGLRSIAVPPLGCGLGGLRWDVVRPRIERAFEPLPDLRVLLYEPGVVPVATSAGAAPELTPGRAALLALIQGYLRGLLDPCMSLLEVHKLMYFMQCAGEPLRLRITKGPYGPYLENLRHVLLRLDRHWITGYGEPQDAPDKPIDLMPHAAVRAEEFLRSHPATQNNIARVLDLIDGFEDPTGMELLASVHWVATRESAIDAASARSRLHSWNERKRRFDPVQVELAWNRLVERGWLSSGASSSTGPG
jgi:O-acetyl-ADP-ribose deacetylase (regulator of RNase III)